MPISLLISTLVSSPSHLPSMPAMVISVFVLGFLLIAGSRAAFKSKSSTRPAERALTGQVDDKGVPVFLDLGPENGSAFTSARAVCRTRTPRR